MTAVLLDGFSYFCMALLEAIVREVLGVVHGSWTMVVASSEHGHGQSLCEGFARGVAGLDPGEVDPFVLIQVTVSTT